MNANRFEAIRLGFANYIVRDNATGLTVGKFTSWAAAEAAEIALNTGTGNPF